MTKTQIKAVLDRVLSWPAERQQDAAEMLLMLEAQEGELYHPSDEEWLAIQEGLDQARRGEFVPDEEMEALWKRNACRRRFWPRSSLSQRDPILE